MVEEGCSPIRLAKRVLLGTMLGDAHIEARTTVEETSKRQLILVHSNKQIPYLVWKIQLLQPLLGDFRLHLYRVSCGKAKPKIYGACRAWSKRCKYLKYTEDDFYFYREGKRKKEVHSNVLNRLTPEGLAVWYQDDGSAECTNSPGKLSLISLAICGFSQQEQELIQGYLKERWNVWGTFRHKSKGYRELIVCGDDMRRFIALVEPHICPSMTYKIDPSHSARHLTYEEGEDIVRSWQQCQAVGRNADSLLEEGCQAGE